MDPLTALSLAGTIVQFVDFGSKLLSDAFQFYKSSRETLNQYEQLQLIIGDLKCVVLKIRRNMDVVLGPAERPLAEDDQQQEAVFHQICDGALEIAEELLDKLEKLDGQPQEDDRKGRVESGKVKRVCHSLLAALKASWSKEEIKTLLQRLSTFRKVLNSKLILAIKDKLDTDAVRASSRFDNLDAQTKLILVSVLNAHRNMPEEIMRAVSMLLCRLQALNQDEHHKTRQMITELRSAENIATGVESITATIEMLDVGNEEEQRVRRSIQKLILQNLHYPTMTNRYEDVLEAHPKTFDWIFASTITGKLPWSDFTNWLRNEQGIYWVNGKAGSGKSTLMKHIYDDYRTRAYLGQWARDQSQTEGDIRVCLATFFFWSCGSDMQKGQQGLLRSLLFQVLGKYPNLIPICFPTRWAKMYSGSLDLGHEVAGPPWSIRELSSAFKALVCQTDTPIKLCFLIDGLDEFDGDTLELCSLVQEVSSLNPNSAKFCVSSRPWIEFQNYFHGAATLRLQDLTYNDIKIYVNDKFRQDQAFRKLDVQDPELISALITETVERAEGVFIWVKLVVRQLLLGVSKRDSMKQLWMRLRSFPKDLYPLYTSILSHIDPIYLEWTSRVFQIIFAYSQLSSDPFRRQSPSLSTSPPSSPFGPENEVGVSQLSLIELCFALEEIPESGFSSVPQLLLMLEETETHLTARCGGLLEVSSSENVEGIQSSFRVIRWMHRTARDFVSESAMWKKIATNDCFREPSVCFTIMKSCIESLCAFTSQNSNEMVYDTPAYSTNITFTSHGGVYAYRRSPEATLASNALVYAYYIDGDLNTRNTRSQLLTKLFNIDVPFRNSSATPQWDSPLHRAALYCLSDFVEDVLSKKARLTRQKSIEDLLHLLCSPMRYALPVYPFPTPKLLNCLVRMGNFAPRYTSNAPAIGTWPKFPGVIGKICFDSISTQFISTSEVPLFIESQIYIIDSFLQAGVDPSNTLDFIPTDFVLCRKSITETVEKAFLASMLEDSDSLAVSMVEVLAKIKKTLIDEVLALQNGQHATKKRKREVVPLSNVILLSDDSDSEDVIFVSERPVDRGKMIKLSEDN